MQNIQRRKAIDIKRISLIEKENIKRKKSGESLEQISKEFYEGQFLLYDCSIFWDLMIQNPKEPPKLNDTAMKCLLLIISKNESLLIDCVTRAIEGISTSQEGFFRLFKFFEAIFLSHKKVILKIPGLIKFPFLFDKTFFLLNRYKTIVDITIRNDRSIINVMENVCNLIIILFRNLFLEQSM